MINLIESKKKLIENLNEICKSYGFSLPAECRKFLLEKIKHVSLKRREYLLTPGQVCKNMYFIHKGLLGDFYAKGKKRIYDWFFGIGQTVVSVKSFYYQIPATHWIEALQDCELFYITYEELELLYRTCVEFHVIAHVLTKKYYLLCHEQADNLRKLSAEERYVLMVETEPELIRLVPQYALASFLDMTTFTLSRLRKKLAARGKRAASTQERTRSKSKQDPKRSTTPPPTRTTKK